VLAFLAYKRLVNPRGTRNLLVAGYLLTALGSFVSLALTYYSVAVIRATCYWCLSSAAIMIVLLVLHALLMQAEPAVEGEPSSVNTILLAACAIVTLFALGVEGTLIVAKGSYVDPRIDQTLPVDVYLPANAHTYGDPTAPVTIVEFADLICPACQREYPKVKEFIGLHPGKVKYVFRHFPMFRLTGHQQALPAAVASEIIGEAGRFWQFVDAMYAESRYEMKDTQPILDILKSMGLDPEKTLARIRNPEDPAFKKMTKDINDASRIGVSGTPTFFIIAPGARGVRLSTMETLFDDLERPEYKKFYKSG
jgi:protein-disulfide isomerase